MGESSIIAAPLYVNQVSFPNYVRGERWRFLSQFEPELNLSFPLWGMEGAYSGHTYTLRSTFKTTS